METLRIIISAIIFVSTLVTFTMLRVRTSIFKDLAYWLNYPEYKQEVSIWEDQKMLWGNLDHKLDNFMSLLYS